MLSIETEVEVQHFVGSLINVDKTLTGGANFQSKRYIFVLSVKQKQNEFKLYKKLFVKQRGSHIKAGFFHFDIRGKCINKSLSTWSAMKYG